ncbi:hypothetical protein [Acidovorax sp. K2F]|uniref:hypothetical protein n=1 Tax=Acidovorax sp. K2F TaxID=2978125 RepID=UPI0021B11E87|nr:hypothetical protein [Acidovorax sp. K2F]MCT6721724.1 hypothetical protein [Acidovorax sp. K2F]
MEIAKHMFDTVAIGAGPWCPLENPDYIEEAISSARRGDMFAPFRPDVLKALVDEYCKGGEAWFAVSKRFRQANYRVPMNDLDRAMRALVETAASDESSNNYSVIIGAALAAAEAGDASAPFDRSVIEALVSLWIRDEFSARDVGRYFARANYKIEWSDLRAAIQREVMLMLGTSKAARIVKLADYKWDRRRDDSGECFTYWAPVAARKSPMRKRT